MNTEADLRKCLYSEAEIALSLLEGSQPKISRFRLRSAAAQGLVSCK